jgi:hypothetical protein
MKYPRLALTKKILSYIIRFALIVALIAEIYSQSWLAAFVVFIALMLTFISNFFERKFKVDIPEEFEIWILIFIYLTLYLGEVQKFYRLFWWWDILLHGFSAISVGLLGFVIMLSLQRGNKVRANPILICLFAFTFAVAIGALWEIFEFSMDQVFGFNMQKSGLFDTMGDLIIDSIGAFIGAFSGYIYLKNQESFFAYTIRAFVNLNSSFFGRIKKDVSKGYSDFKKLKIES